MFVVIVVLAGFNFEATQRLVLLNLEVDFALRSSQ
jgi:hypothetical protein